jgi:hypothetical protein
MTTHEYGYEIDKLFRKKQRRAISSEVNGRWQDFQVRHIEIIKSQVDFVNLNIDKFPDYMLRLRITSRRIGRL